MIVILLLLAAVALLCTAVGQLTAILERLESRGDRRVFTIYKLVLDRSRIGDHHLFHLHGWPPPLIVSQAVKNVLERLGVTKDDRGRETVSGITFEEVLC